MKKLLCLFIAMLLIVTCTACSAAVEDYNSDGPFVFVESGFLANYWYKIVYHKDTKVMYVVGHYDDFTVMLNPDGSPMIYEEA